MKDSGNRKRLILWHSLAVAAILLISCVLFYKHFYTSGTLIHVDMTYPTSIDRNIALYFNSWWQYGSVTNIWNLQRVFWSYPLLLVSKVLGLSVSSYLLVMYIGTFFLAGVTMYALAFSVIKSTRLGVGSRLAPYAGAVFAAVVYMYNPWSLSHFWPYFGYPGYALQPLVFLLLVKAVASPRARYIVPLAVVIAVASTGPICIVWFWFLILTYLLFHLVVKRFSRQSLLAAVKVVVPLGVLYALLSAAWVLPYAWSRLSGKPFSPSYLPEMSERMLDMFSATNSVMNNMRLASGWGMPVEPQVTGWFWVLLSFALPALSILALVVLYRRLRRNGTIIYWALMFAVSVLLATGTVFILRKPYYYFILRGPGSSSFGWILRAFDRWLYYAPVFFALMLALLVARLLSSRRAAQGLAAALVILVVLISFWPIARDYANTVYNPTKIPDDYAQVDEFVDESTPGARPVWLPFARSGFQYYWAPEKRIAPFNVISSNPNLNNLQDLFAEDNFYFWLESLYSQVAAGPFKVMDRRVMLRKDLASRLFVPFSAKYLVLDTSVPGYQFANNFNMDPSLKSVKKTSLLEVFEFDATAAHLRPAPRTLRIDNHYDELAVAQRLTPEQLARISFMDRNPKSDMEPGYGVLDIRDFKEPYDIDGDFEGGAGPGGAPQGWALQKADPRFEVSTDSGSKRSGQRSLYVRNASSQDYTTARLVGREVGVAEGEVYSMETSIRYRNAEWTNASVEGLDTKSGEWVTIVNCPPVSLGRTEGWKRHTCSFYMPAGFSMIRLVLSAGWSANLRRGPGESWFDDIKLARLSDRLYAELTAGDGASPEVTWEQVSAQRYRVKVRGASEPFILVFGEAFDPLWLATTSDGRKIDPVRQYSVITGFPMEAGDTDLVIEYIPQAPFWVGLVVSSVVLVLCIIYCLVVAFRRRREV